VKNVEVLSITKVENAAKIIVKKGNSERRWTPGHEGVEGNEIEKVDSLAKAGASMSLVAPEPYCGVKKEMGIQNLSLGG